MPLPKLGELLNFYRYVCDPKELDPKICKPDPVHTLPAQIDPLDAGKTIEKDVRPCDDRWDKKAYRLFGYQDPDHAIFVSLPLEKTPTWRDAQFWNPDDALYRRLSTGTGGFQYTREIHDKDGRSAEAGPGVLELCRDAKAVPEHDASGMLGGYAVYVTDNSLLNNVPQNAAPLRPVPMQFRTEEIIAIVQGLKNNLDGSAFQLPSAYYLVDETDPTKLRLMPDLKTVETIVAGLERDDSPIQGERRDLIVKALHEFAEKEIAAQDTISWQFIFGLVATIIAPISVVLMVWQVIKMKKVSVEAAVAAARATKEDAKAREITSEKVAFEVLDELGEDMLEKAKAGDYEPYVEPSGYSRIKPLYQKLKGNNVSMLWKAGGGKSAVAEGLAQYVSKLPESEKAVMYGIDLTKFEAGTMYRGTYATKVAELESAIAYLKKSGHEVFIFTDEVAQKGAESGAMESGQAEKVLNALKPFLAKTNGFLIAAVPEEWERTLGKDPAVVRRFEPFSPSLYGEKQVGEVLLDQETRSFISKKYGQDRIRWSDDAVDKILELAKAFYPEESLIASGKKVARSIVAPGEKDTENSKVIGAKEVYQRFADAKNWTIGDLEQRLKLIKRLVARKQEYEKDASLKMLTGQSEDRLRLTPEQAQEVVKRWSALSEEDQKIYKRFSWAESLGGYPRSFIENVIDPSVTEAQEGIDLAGIQINTASAADIAKAGPRNAYTVGDFEILLTAKYETLYEHVDPGTLSRMAKAAFDLWDKDGRKLDTVKGHRIPKEIYFEKVMDHLVKRLTPQQMATPSGLAFLELQKKPAQGEALVDRLPVETSEMAERIFEMSVKGEAK